ncbi:hypothetical protein BOX15_Mlig022657g1, partial [Macrostomum lignano]
FPPNFAQIGQQFTEAFYGTLQTNKEQLVNFYHDQAMLTYEGSQVQGKAGILEKYKSLSFQRIAAAVTNADYQPMENGVLIAVNGQLKVDDSPQALAFCESFLLRNFGGNFAIVNHVFRLSIHNF